MQWSPFPARDFWVVSTSNQKALVWNLAAPSRGQIEHVLHAHRQWPRQVLSYTGLPPADAAEFETLHIRGSNNVPLDVLAKNVDGYIRTAKG